MLVPGQAFGAATYQVYTCLHGFSSGNATNNIAYYFVPYGVTVSSDPYDPNYVRNKGFKVTHVKHFRLAPAGTNLGINDLFFSHESPEVSMPVLYSNRDYAVATIEGQTLNDTSLKDLLIAALHLIQAGDNALPTLNADGNGLLLVDNALPFDPVTERLFVIGLASLPDAALDHDIAVSTALMNEGAVNNPRRSFGDDQNIKSPPDINSRVEEDSSSLTSFSGISGGPILRCRLDPLNEGNKRCVVVGTNFGAERIFNGLDPASLEKFGNIINKIP